MNLVFKLHVAKQPQTEEMGEYRPARFWPEQDAIAAIDSFLAPRQLTASQLFQHRKAQPYRELPWATLILRRGAALAGHLAELRYPLNISKTNNPTPDYGTSPLKQFEADGLQIRISWIIETGISRWIIWTPLWDHDHHALTRSCQKHTVSVLEIGLALRLINFLPFRSAERTMYPPFFCISEIRIPCDTSPI